MECRVEVVPKHDGERRVSIGPLDVGSEFADLLPREANHPNGGTKDRRERRKATARKSIGPGCQA